MAVDDASCAADRPGLRRALDYVREGDMLAVWKLDRLGGSSAGLTALTVIRLLFAC
jgi:DNA invertase Pin-like site-specific DNA recombinase